ncbi:MAG: nucleoside-diphosphate sugar epimerase/dehydratase [Gammaproteobacteria bacterium]|jgi:FlaA1/EpsC-like NDP-sugar epimerase|nr:polysaccharide biosynthesis protein [Chromatiales bacterium]MDP7418306.1 nucleoside-diphosphate sugar epimerase/dehydratase [Gammaproteobacteria bacterium]MDP7660594.1 nucleoside-diphosphate sugar epimerase/dehydratase [Gammaproteobacteria bacterium]HJP39759.1 nucleoside-diphosphate sugar epimerase/dehydratase [Gammaproteobacteria bacterium]
MIATNLQIRLVQLSRRTKQAIAILSDISVLLTALAGTIILFNDQAVSAISERALLFLATVVIALPVFIQQGLYRAIIRFVGVQMIFGVLRSVSIVTLLLAGVSFVIGLDSAAVIFSTTLVFWAFALLGIVGSRFVMRTYLMRAHSVGERVAVYGAGEAGVNLVTALAGGEKFAPVAYLDDSLALQGRSINGLQVYSPDALSQLVSEFGVTRVLLALPSVSRWKRRQIINNLESAAVRVQTIPDITDIVAGHARVDEIRDVDVGDLLGRNSIAPNEKLLDACIRDKSVAVTGAGGSIGSELCRQILQLQPRRLVLLEISEAVLYEADREMRQIIERDELKVELVPLLASAHHRARVQVIFETFKVQTVYHAAAYKHVPMVEHNMVEGVHNNIFGTLHTAQAAQASGVETFVLVSTDKAVSPTNVMGATKRLAELVLQGLHQRNVGTRFCMVRFGNVLASSGSVVPLFRDQIRRGGPVTVTHPEIIRYFMTIPEAAQLVIQAGSMGEGGDVFVLDMGQPVHIRDLAQRMIHLMGLTVRDEEEPEGDIAIEYIGLRPAEKLYEELLIGSNVQGTEHPMIMRAMEESLPWEQLQAHLDGLLAAIKRFDCEQARDILLSSVSGYQPNNGIDDLVWQAQHGDQGGEFTAAPQSVVTPIDSRRPTGSS